MAAGIATLSELRKAGQFEKLEQKGQLLSEGIARAIDESEVKAQIVRIGALFCLFFTAEPVVDYASAKTSDTALFWSFLLEYVATGNNTCRHRSLRAVFISLALEDEMIEETVKAMRVALGESV